MPLQDPHQVTVFPWGTLEACAGPERGNERTAPASYDWLGNRFLWRPLSAIRGRLALDVERLDTPLPDISLVGSRSGPEFWAAWTRLEVLAKLSREPVLSLLRKTVFGSPEWHPGRAAQLEENCHARLATFFRPERELVFTCGFIQRQHDEAMDAFDIQADGEAHGCRGHADFPKALAAGPR